MSARVPAGFFETTLHFTIPGQSGDVVTSLGWSGFDAADPPDFGDVGTAMAQLQGNISNECTLTTITFNLGSADADNPTHDEAIGFDGESSGLACTPNISLLVQKRTALGGRRHRGRNYYPGLTTSAFGSSGFISSDVLTGLQTNWDGMVASMGELGAGAQLFHQSAPFAPTSVSGFSVQAKIATQRTRLRD